VLQRSGKEREKGAGKSRGSGGGRRPLLFVSYCVNKVIKSFPSRCLLVLRCPMVKSDDDLPPARLTSAGGPIRVSAVSKRYGIETKSQSWLVGDMWTCFKWSGRGLSSSQGCHQCPSQPSSSMPSRSAYLCTKTLRLSSTLSCVADGPAWSRRLDIDCLKALWTGALQMPAVSYRIVSGCRSFQPSIRVGLIIRKAPTVVPTVPSFYSSPFHTTPGPLQSPDGNGPKFIRRIGIANGPWRGSANLPSVTCQLHIKCAWHASPRRRFLSMNTEGPYHTQ
jgi:hypothetical protein